MQGLVVTQLWVGPGWFSLPPDKYDKTWSNLKHLLLTQANKMIQDLMIDLVNT